MSEHVGYAPIGFVCRTPNRNHDHNRKRSAPAEINCGEHTLSQLSAIDYHHRRHDFDLGQPHPKVFRDGNSTVAGAMTGRVSDRHFSDGGDFDDVTGQIAEVHATAQQRDRRVRFGAGGFPIAWGIENAAKEVLRQIDVGAAQAFDAVAKQAGKSTGNRTGMWQVQHNDDFRTRLTGTPKELPTRIADDRRRGVDLPAGGSLDQLEETKHFGSKVLPIVREPESDLDRSPATPELLPAR